MGLDIGIITIKYLERPDSVAYDFAWELAHEASVGGYMHGEGNNWGAFTQRQVLGMLDDFAEKRNLHPILKAEILAWVRSLPWDGWRDTLAVGDTTEDDDYSPILAHSCFVKRSYDQFPARIGSSMRAYLLTIMVS